MEEKEAKQASLELIESEEVLYLSTIDSNGFPQTRAMGNLRNTEKYPGLRQIFREHTEDFLIYIATGTTSAKMDHIRANPKASVYFCKADEVCGLMLAGTVEIVTDDDLKKRLWQDGWEMYWPGGVDDPEYTVLRLLPAFAKGWSKEGPFEFKLS